MTVVKTIPPHLEGLDMPAYLGAVAIKRLVEEITNHSILVIELSKFARYHGFL